MYKTNGIYVNTCMFVRMYGLDSCMYVYAPHPFFFSLLSFLSSIDGRPASRTAKAQQNQKKERENRECTHICAFYGTQRRSSEGGSYEQGVKTKRTESKRAYKSALFVG